MWWLFHRHLRGLVDAPRIEKAVAAAEAKTQGEIVVSIAPFFLGSVERSARRAFDKLGVARTADRCGVLLFLVPGRRRFFILGDEGVHGKVGQVFWNEVAAILGRELRASNLTDAVVRGVEMVGAALAQHFPASGPRKNALPDAPDLPD